MISASCDYINEASLDIKKAGGNKTSLDKPYKNSTKTRHYKKDNPKEIKEE